MDHQHSRRRDRHDRRHRRLVGLVGVVSVVGLLAACSSDGGSAGTPSTPTTSPSGSSDSPGTSVSEAPRGWIDGEPEWSASGSGADRSTADASGTAPLSEAATEAPTMVDPESTPTDDDVISPPIDNSPLRAGNVDDNADFAAFVDYLTRIDSIGVVTRPFDPTGRIVVSAALADGLPAAGVEIVVSAADGAEVATVRTTADGTARFLPALYGEIQPIYTFDASGVTAEAAPDGTASLIVTSARATAAPIALDVLFLLDATGSMGDEIDRLKTTIDSVAGRIAGLDTQPDVRFAMTLYRDLDDSFVTSTYDFTGSIDDFRTALGKVVAEGGDDYPEALDEGLAEALGAPSWRDPASTVQLVFLVADAPPQVGRQVDVTYTESIVDAVSRGIKIIPIASSESDDQAEAVFRQIAVTTGARFVFLSNGAAGAATGTNTDIEMTDYEELSLDDLIVRLVSEELAAMTGTPPIETTQTTEPPVPTNPPGQ